MRIAIENNVFVRIAGEGQRAIWFIHGYGDSGWSFVPLFGTELARDFALLVPDLPGFGVSPPQLDRASIDGMADVVVGLIDRVTPTGPIGLVGHSLGGPIAVRVVRRLAARVRALFSVEGNLTAADAYFSGKAAEADDPAAFRASFTDTIWRLGATRADVRRYHGSLALADPETLWHLGRSSTPASRDGSFGVDYRSLTCPTLYYWSELTTPDVTQRYLDEHAIAQRQYRDAGHWPMVDIPGETGLAMSEFFRAS